MPGVPSHPATCAPPQQCGFEYQWKDAGSPDILMVCVVGIVACLAWLGQLAHEATASKET